MIAVIACSALSVSLLVLQQSLAMSLSQPGARMIAKKLIKCELKVHRRGTEGFGAIQANAEVAEFGHYALHGHYDLSERDHSFQLQPCPLLGLRASWKRGHHSHCLSMGFTTGSTIWMEYEVSTVLHLPSATVAATAGDSNDMSAVSSNPEDDEEWSETPIVPLGMPADSEAASTEMPAPRLPKKRRRRSHA